MSDQHKIAVVILNWNGRHWLEKFLPLTIKYSKEVAQVYVIDNASTDDSISFLSSHFPEVEIIINKSNLGFAAGYNAGLKQIKSRYYVLLNSDVEVTPYWLSGMTDVLDRSGNVAAVQPKILSYDRKDLFEYAGAAGGYIDRFGYTFCRGRVFNAIEQDRGQFDEEHNIFWGSGACLMIRSNVYHKLGGLDPDFFAHMEEIDLCWRIHHIGMKVTYCPSSTIYHVGGGTLSQTNPKKTYLNFRNNLIMLYKNLTQKRMFQIVLYRMLLDGLAGVLAIYQRRFKDFVAIIKAHWSFLGGFSKWKRKRNRTKELCNGKMIDLNGIDGYYPKSVVWQYFFKRNKSYDSLDN